MNIFSSKSYLQITHHPTLNGLLLVRAHWTHHGYEFCNMEWIADVNHGGDDRQPAEACYRE
jgi:hypothetical protein